MLIPPGHVPIETVLEQAILGGGLYIAVGPVHGIAGARVRVQALTGHAIFFVGAKVGILHEADRVQGEGLAETAIAGGDLRQFSKVRANITGQRLELLSLNIDQPALAQIIELSELQEVDIAAHVEARGFQIANQIDI